MTDDHVPSMVSLLFFDTANDVMVATKRRFGAIAEDCGMSSAVPISAFFQPRSLKMATSVWTRSDRIVCHRFKDVIDSTLDHTT